MFLKLNSHQMRPGQIAVRLFQLAYCRCSRFVSACSDCTDDRYPTLRNQGEKARRGNSRVLRWDFNKHSTKHVTSSKANEKKKKKKSNGDHKFYSTVRLYVNAGFQLGIEWEVTGGEAANGEQRSSCIRGLARAQGSMWRTEPSDLLPATSPHPLLLSQENSTALVLSMDCYITVSTILQPEMEPFQLKIPQKEKKWQKTRMCYSVS